MAFARPSYQPKPPPPESVYKSMPEPDIARRAIRMYMGELDRVDANAPEGEETTGQFTFTEGDDLSAFQRRVEAIVHRQQPDDNLGHALCMRRAVLEQSKSDAEFGPSRSPKPAGGDHRNRRMAITETGHGDRRNRASRSPKPVMAIA